MPLGWLLVGGVAVVAVTVLSLAVGAVSLSPGRVFLEVLDHVPGLRVHSGLSETDAQIVWQLRLPRVVLGLLVGAMLAMAGSAYQGAFRNPLADPYTLGAASGAGLGATIAIVFHLTGARGPFSTVPLAAFVGALVAVALAYVLASMGGSSRSPAVLLLAGIAVQNFLTAIQTYLQQHYIETIREVYSWVLGRLATSGWDDVLSVLPYFAITSVVLLTQRRKLDVLAVGDDEAATLGLDVRRTRLLIVAMASLATAAAVSVSGLIAFVGLIVPHTVRLLTRSSYRVVLPLSILFGAAFLAGTDVVARTQMAPAEIPIGVITAFIGAPFFAFVLRSRRRATL
ncbi:MAG: iron ABC transporter permease [Acidobacteria bacterium]|nr:iron ABC transporter permease [Acidobacteriota bacterium]